jgi:DNA invertase Pin-like site-specific DNA recombinase
MWFDKHGGQRMNQFSPSHQKVKPQHLQRGAFLYVRQSSMPQVLENTESIKRQYGLQERVLALGWRSEQIRIIDCDQGRSGATDAGRDGFEQLLVEVSMGNVGLVTGLEASRLARNNADWHRLLQLCASTDSLILDQNGVYDLGCFNDRLLLGLKGTMSEVELHVLGTRLQEGIISEAPRSELKIPLPAGLEYAPMSMEDNE